MNNNKNKIFFLALGSRNSLRLVYQYVQNDYYHNSIMMMITRTQIFLSDHKRDLMTALLLSFELLLLLLLPPPPTAITLS